MSSNSVKGAVLLLKTAIALAICIGIFGCGLVVAHLTKNEKLKQRLRLTL